MASGSLQAAIGQLRRVVGRRGGCALSDPQLLHDFVTQHDEAAFEVLIWRHGALVLNLCQRVLRDSHAAEDAFQATFLVFARKADSIGRGEAVASWLYRVAFRVALRLRARLQRGGPTEPADDLPARAEAEDVLWRDLRPVLDEEIERLPEKYRAPFILCYLQGQTNEEAAAQLGCPKGTILSRLARGRQRLRSRLARRGLALAAGGVAVTLPQHAAAAVVPAALVTSTIEAALPFAAGHAATGLVSASVAALTEGVLHAMFLTKLKIVTAALVALAVLLGGAGSFTAWTLAQDAGRREGAAQRGGERPAARDNNPAPLTGKVVAVSGDNMRIIIETPAQGRGEQPKRTEVTFGDKTEVSYDNVGPNEAVPTKGYLARVWAEGSAPATRVSFIGPLSSRAMPNFAGRVVAVAKDGKGLTLEVQEPRGRGEEGKKVDVRLNDKTIIAYTGVVRGEAKLTEGYLVQVWLEEETKDNSAAQVRLIGTQTGQRGEPNPDVRGKVAAVAADGKTLTVEVPAQQRGEAPAKVEIELGEQTTIRFTDVGPDAARLADGMRVMVWLQEGSKSRAARVLLIGEVPQRWHEIAGIVAGSAKDGSTLTLEQPPRARGEEAKRVEIKLTAKTRVIYSGIGPGEAQPTAGYHAVVRLADGSGDTATQVLLHKAGREGRR